MRNAGRAIHEERMIRHALSLADIEACDEFDEARNDVMGRSRAG
jgi:hypothetical protein